MMSSITLSLSIQKSNLQILHITFCKFFFLNLKNRNGLPNIFFYSILKIVLKSGSQTQNIKIII